MLRVSGEFCHMISAVHPNPDSDQTRKFSQCYFLDPSAALDARMANQVNANTLRRPLLEELSSVINQINILAKSYVNMRQVEEVERIEAEVEGREVASVFLCIHTDKRGDDQRRYNQPTTDDIACVFKSVDGQPPESREFKSKLIIPQHGKYLKTISTLHPMIDAFTYPMFIPSGAPGWSTDMWQVNPQAAVAEEEKLDELGKIF